LDLAFQAKGWDDESWHVIDLHVTSVPLAKAIVRATLLRIHAAALLEVSVSQRDINSVEDNSSSSAQCSTLTLQRSVGENKGLAVITGRGRHSPGGEAKVRTAVGILLRSVVESIVHSDSPRSSNVDDHFFGCSTPSQIQNTGVICVGALSVRKLCQCCLSDLECLLFGSNEGG
jgi:hypothetical protein